MTGVDEEVEEMLAACPILSDGDFLRKHPGVADVAGFLNSAAKVHYLMKQGYEPFDRIGVKNIRDFLAQLQEGNPKAAETYTKVRDILCLG